MFSSLPFEWEVGVATAELLVVVNELDSVEVADEAGEEVAEDVINVVVACEVLDEPEGSTSPGLLASIVNWFMLVSL